MKTISKIFKSIWNFLKNPKVKFWCLCMAIVIVISVTVTSIIMVTSSVEYSKKLRPYASNIESIEVVNSHGKNILKYNREAGAEKAIDQILKKLHSGAKTNRLSQFINGEANGSETIKLGSVPLSTLDSTYILIRFDVESEHKYTITKPESDKPYVVGTYDPDYGKNGNAIISNIQEWTYHNTLVVNAIYIPISSKNSFSKRNWYICLGDQYMRSTSINYTYETYGNYSSLYKYVKDIDKSTIL